MKKGEKIKCRRRQANRNPGLQVGEARQKYKGKSKKLKVKGDGISNVEQGMSNVEGSLCAFGSQSLCASGYI
jgi:hypothetical protein